MNPRTSTVYYFSQCWLSSSLRTGTCAGNPTTLNLVLFGFFSNGASYSVCPLFLARNIHYILKNVQGELIQSGISSMIQRGAHSSCLILWECTTHTIHFTGCMCCLKGMLNSIPSSIAFSDIYSSSWYVCKCHRVTNITCFRHVLGSWRLSTTREKIWIMWRFANLERSMMNNNI